MWERGKEKVPNEKAEMADGASDHVDITSGDGAVGEDRGTATEGKKGGRVRFKKC